jgi:hypothetical protein
MFLGKNVGKQTIYLGKECFGREKALFAETITAKNNLNFPTKKVFLRPQKIYVETLGTKNSQCYTQNFLIESKNLLSCRIHITR